MANVIVSTTATFNTAQAYNRSMFAVIAGLGGTTDVKFVKANNLVGNWKGADTDKAYAGLIPVIKGVQRIDLALLMGDLIVDSATDYASGSPVEIKPTDRLHTKARELADAAGATYDTILDGIVAEFNTKPGTIVPVDQLTTTHCKWQAKAATGRLYWRTIFGCL